MNPTEEAAFQALITAANAIQTRDRERALSAIVDAWRHTWDLFEGEKPAPNLTPPTPQSDHPGTSSS